MHHGTKKIELPELTANRLRDKNCLIDNLFAELWKHMGMKARLNRIGFAKRSGTSAHELVYCLMIWVWLKVDSIGMFALESLKTFSCAEKDPLYAALNQEDWNWRYLHRVLHDKRSEARRHRAMSVRLYWMIPFRCAMEKRCLVYSATLTTQRDGTLWGNRF